MRFLLPPHLLTNFETQKYYQNEPKFNGVFVYKYCWSATWNSKCKCYLIFFSNNKTSQKITEYNKKKKKHGKILMTVYSCHVTYALQNESCNDTMVREEILIAEKIIKPFPNENIILNKKFSNRKPDIWFKNHNLVIKVYEENHENYGSDNEKEREDMFKKHNFKTF